MTNFNFTNVKNRAKGQIASSMTTSDTSFSYAAGDGANFPNPPYKVTIGSEVIRVLSQVGDDVLVCERGVEGTIPEAHSRGSYAKLNIYAGDIQELQEAIRDLENRAGYKHVQSTPSDSWVIQHNLHRVPSVVVMDSANELVIGEIEVVNDDTIILHFTSGFSGKAYLN